MIIIKSGSRTTASFSQLLHYMNKGRVEEDEYFFKHNVYSNKSYGIVGEFKQNHKLLKKRKNGVALYHEYISIKYQKGYSKEELRQILFDLAEQYVKLRADNCLVYSVVHEQHNQIHLHFMISGNEIESSKAHYFSQAEFEEIKNKTREYAYEKYPKLERQELTKKKARAKSKTIDSEIQFKKRTGKQSDREIFKKRIHKIFIESKTQEDFINALKTENIQIYQRGKTFGFIDSASGKKYRLKTLELEDEFKKMSQAFEAEISEHTKKSTKEHYIPFSKSRERTHAQSNDSHFAYFRKRKLYVKESIEETMNLSANFEEFLEHLAKKKLQIYAIEDIFGFVDLETERRYRLKTLGLESHFDAFINKVSEKNDFKSKLKNFGKRLFHEVINDAEHLITGKKSVMEDEIWTQENAGQRKKTENKNFKTSNEYAREAFKKQMKQARKQNQAVKEKQNIHSKK